MPIDHNRKLIFIHIPKNAGTAIERHCNMKDTGHKNWKYYFSKYLSEWEEYTSFAIIRDPVDRFISSYRYARMKKSYWHDNPQPNKAIYGEHPDYQICNKFDINSLCSKLNSNAVKLSHPGWLPQYKWICNWRRKVKIDVLIKYENLNKGLETLKIHDLPKLNFSKGSEDLEITEENKSFLRSFYKKDYKLLESIKN